MKTLALPVLSCAGAGMVLVGCSAPGMPVQSPPAATSIPAGSAAPASDGGAAKVGIDPATPPKAIGVVEVSCDPGYGLTKVTIGVLSVQRRASVAIATFVVTGVRQGPAPTPADASRAPSLGYCSQGAFEPRLVDGQNLLGYEPIKLGTADWLRSDPYRAFPSDTPTYLSAVFPAPKPGVTSIDVIVGAGTVTGVPVS